jgi:uncharacterized membrane protein
MIAVMITSVPCTPADRRRHGRPRGVSIPSLAIATLVCGAAAQAPARKYVLRELPPVSPYGTGVFDINDAGVVVGQGLTPSLQVHALRWSGTGVVDLTPANALAQAQGISEGGIAAGFMQNAAGVTEAVRFGAGTPALLGWLPGHVGSLAQDVSDSGIVAGWSVTSVGDPVATVWANGQIQAIGGLHSWAFAVSETGDVVGRRYAGVDIEAFRWRNGQVTLLQDLGPNHAQAVGASPHGRASGSAQSPRTGTLHAVVWAPDGTATDLGPFVSPAGTFAAQANDVNDAGVAVGMAIIDPVGEIFYAMVWRGGAAEDLNTLIQPGTGWTLYDAQAVNARGEIVGTGLRGGFLSVHSFLLRPDCDGDGIADLDEIAAGTEHDANRDGIADACQHCQRDLGARGPGAMTLSVCGDQLTSAGSAATVSLRNAAVGAPLFLVLGLTQQPIAIAGGTLVPGEPRFVTGLVAGPDGSLAFPLSGLGPNPQAVYAQAVALAGPQVEFSNAVEVQLGMP